MIVNNLKVINQLLAPEMIAENSIELAEALKWLREIHELRTRSLAVADQEITSLTNIIRQLSECLLAIEGAAFAGDLDFIVTITRLMQPIAEKVGNRPPFPS